MGSVGGNLYNSAMCIQLASKPSLFFALCTQDFYISRRFFIHIRICFWE